MKKEFIGYYHPTADETNASWENGTFVFDANVLLNLYRYSESTRKDFISVLKKLKEKLFLPHQVGLEFHSNRLNVIRGLEQSYKALEDVIDGNYEKSLRDLI